MAVASVKQKSYAARQDSVLSNFTMAVVPGSGNHAYILLVLRRKQKSPGIRNQPAMVKDAWTGWGKIIDGRLA